MIKLDFTIDALLDLYIAISKEGYKFMPVAQALEDKYYGRLCVLRHDVDKGYKQALAVARIENSLGFTTTYYFRYGGNFNREIVRKIASLGHEIGYHYEVLSKVRGDFASAIALFKEELAALREIADIKTISAHGSILSIYDNRKLWTKYDYKDYGITGVAHLSFDFNKILYLTDTGRGWNKKIGNVRDWVDSGDVRSFKNTFELINCIKSGGLPDRIFLSIHPQRWYANFALWFYELIAQNFKNIFKFCIGVCYESQND
jgi:hypothetical protein